MAATTLRRPDVALAVSLRETVEDFVAAGERIPGAALEPGWTSPDSLSDDEGLAAYVAEQVRFADPAGDFGDRVPCEYYWMADESGDVVGFLALRLQLNDFLRDIGGHVGYSVRPRARRRGHASQALALAVTRAGTIGLGRLLLTCDEDNQASARTIEGGGGVLEDVRSGKRRYWIDVPPPHSGR